MALYTEVQWLMICGYICFHRSEPKKTKVKKRTLNPQFEESFLFEVTLSSFLRKLTSTCKKGNQLSRNTFLETVWDTEEPKHCSKE